MLLTADRIHTGKCWLPEGAIIDVADDGSINGILEKTDEDVKRYNGVLTPGFINVHCHLELSHMKGKVAECTGLVPFLQKVNTTRNDHTEEDKVAARCEALDAMYNNGIVAVGDIANIADTVDLRAKGKMHFHSFVESIGFNPAPQRAMERAESTYQTFNSQESVEDVYLRQSITPHAPYSVSEGLFRAINDFDPNSLLSIHNQECAAEDEYYTHKKGALRDMLLGMGLDDSFFEAKGLSSLQTYINWLSPKHQVIFVHNTYAQKEDIQRAEQHFEQVYWCLCPNANKYIENRLPDIAMIMQYGTSICVGTDSLSSNHQLCILSELKTIKNEYPHISWETLLQWGTLNGARALKMEDTIGSIEVGKRPGLILIDDLDKVKPTVKRL